MIQLAGDRSYQGYCPGGSSMDLLGNAVSIRISKKRDPLCPFEIFHETFIPCPPYQHLFIRLVQIIPVNMQPHFLYLFPEWRGHEGNKHQSNTRVTAYTVRTGSSCLTPSPYHLLMASQSIIQRIIICDRVREKWCLLVRHRFYSWWQSRRLCKGLWSCMTPGLLNTGEFKDIIQ